MGESEAAPGALSRRPTIVLPPRPPMESWFGAGAGASPGPLTLVSSFFSDGCYSQSECPTFTQLLAGAMASPVLAAAAAAARTSFLPEDSSSKGSGDGTSEELGFKQNRPVGLVIAPRSPIFTVPPGLSPSGLLNSPGFFSPGQGPFGMSHQQALAQVTAQALLSQSQMHMETGYQHSLIASYSESSIQDLIPSANEDQKIPPLISDPNDSTITESSDISHSDKKSELPVCSNKPADDGYNWRKYGQKQVKGSEYPRSYYRCTHFNCPVKKKVERAPNGQITEIIYKGQHNHERSQSNKRARDGSDGIVPSQGKGEVSIQDQARDANNGIIPSQGKGEVTMPGLAAVNMPSKTVDSDSVIRKNQDSDQAAPALMVGSKDSERVGTAETKYQMMIGNEPNPKRSCIEGGASDPVLMHETSTESKIIVQTRSEVDLLDDGYRWRKYGQKIVKGNHHPRSYYKCTSAGCNVRKHVERATTDSKAVITTYEGKHNHDIPALRKSSHNTTDSAPQLKPSNLADKKHVFLKERDGDITKDTKHAFLKDRDVEK